jgi:hypothetical protein
MQHLKIAAIPVCVYIVGNRGSAMFDGEAEGVNHRLMQLRDSGRRQSRGVRERMNPGGEQDLIDIDISETGEECLIQQQGLDARFSLSQAGRKRCQADLKRLRPEFRNARVAPLNPPELPRVVVKQHAVVEGENSVGVGGLGATREEFPSHAEMQDQAALV